MLTGLSFQTTIDFHLSFSEIIQFCVEMKSADESFRIGYLVSNVNTIKYLGNSTFRYINVDADQEQRSFVSGVESIKEDSEIYRFSVEIIHGGEGDNIVIGLNSNMSDKTPGMNSNTIGLFGSDGIIVQDAEAVLSAEFFTFTTGDVITCEVYRVKNAIRCQFLINDEQIAEPSNIKGKIHYPSVGLHSPGAEVRIKLDIDDGIGEFLSA